LPQLFSVSPTIAVRHRGFLRGLACISVLAFHFLSRGPQTHTMPGVAFPLVEVAARYGYLGVHLFFVISGFVILMSAQAATARKGSVSAVVVVVSIVTAFFALFWLIASGRFRMKASPLIYYVGALTYPLYVVHQNLGFMIYGRLHKASGMVTVSLVLMLAVLLLISWCIHAYVERSLSQVLRRWLGLTFQSSSPRR
jgi:peptidoglycan/LPS O-acetylase OafA/YrhL